MTTPIEALLRDALDLLHALDRERLEPEDAWPRFEALRRTHADARLELVWERESISGGLHYDLLVAGADGTLSLGWCPDRATPWPMRGTQRWSESFIVRVDGHVLHVGEALSSLEHAWRERDVARHLVDLMIVNAALRDGKIEVGDDELEAAFSEFRRERGLFSAVDVEAWIVANGSSQSQLESNLRYRIGRDRLRARVTGDGRVQARFEATRGAYDSMQLARLCIADPAEAEALGRRLGAQPGAFYEVAQARFIAGGAAEPLFARLRRGELDDERARALWTAAPGQVAGPFASVGGHELALVLTRQAAQLDAATRALIEHELFEEWLAEQRSAARIEWFWGLDGDQQRR